MKRNTHLPKSAYLSNARIGELLRAELHEQLTENFESRREPKSPSRGRQNKIKVEVFYDKRDGTYGVETLVGADVYDIAHGTTLLDAIDSAMGEHDVQDLDENPPEWVVDEELWDRAKEQVQPYWEEYDDPWAVVATVYKQMGGEVR